MRSAFGKLPTPREVIQISFQKDHEPTIGTILTSGDSIKISVEGDKKVAFDCELFADEAASYPKWEQMPPIRAREFAAGLEAADLGPETQVTPEILKRVLAQIVKRLCTRPAGALPGFLVYAPENSVLRTFQAEGQILPLGIKGEGLFAHLKGLDSATHRERLERIREKLKLIDWFETFVIPENLSPGERIIKIQDRYLSDGTLFDQRRRTRDSFSSSSTSRSSSARKRQPSSRSTTSIALSTPSCALRCYNSSPHLRMIMTSKSFSRPTTRRFSTASTSTTNNSCCSSWIVTRTVIPASVAWTRRRQVRVNSR